MGKTHKRKFGQDYGKKRVMALLQEVRGKARQVLKEGLRLERLIDKDGV